MLKFGLLRL